MADCIMVFTVQFWARMCFLMCYFANNLLRFYKVELPNLHSTIFSRMVVFVWAFAYSYFFWLVHRLQGVMPWLFLVLASTRFLGMAQCGR